MQIQFFPFFFNYTLSNKILFPNAFWSKNRIKYTIIFLIEISVKIYDVYTMTIKSIPCGHFQLVIMNFLFINFKFERCILKFVLNTLKRSKKSHPTSKET